MGLCCFSFDLLQRALGELFPNFWGGDLWWTFIIWFWRPVLFSFSRIYFWLLVRPYWYSALYFSPCRRLRWRRRICIIFNLLWNISLAGKPADHIWIPSLAFPFIILFQCLFNDLAQIFQLKIRLSTITCVQAIYRFVLFFPTIKREFVNIYELNFIFWLLIHF